MPDLLCHAKPAWHLPDPDIFAMHKRAGEVEKRPGDVLRGKIPPPHIKKASLWKFVMQICGHKSALSCKKASAVVCAALSMPFLMLLGLQGRRLSCETARLYTLRSRLRIWLQSYTARQTSFVYANPASETSFRYGEGGFFPLIRRPSCTFIFISPNSARVWSKCNRREAIKCKNVWVWKNARFVMQIFHNP